MSHFPSGGDANSTFDGSADIPNTFEKTKKKYVLEGYMVERP